MCKPGVDFLKTNAMKNAICVVGKLALHFDQVALVFKSQGRDYPIFESSCHRPALHILWEALVFGLTPPRIKPKPAVSVAVDLSTDH